MNHYVRGILSVTACMLLGAWHAAAAETAGTDISGQTVQDTPAPSAGMVVADTGTAPEVSAAPSGRDAKPAADTARVRFDRVRIMPASPAEYTLLRVRVAVSGAMDTTMTLKAVFGSAAPYDDYTLTGVWTGPDRWEGQIPFTRITDNGQEMTLEISGGRGVNGSLPAVHTIRFRPGSYHLFYQGAALFDNKEYRAARQVLDRFLTAEPGYAEALVYLAKIALAEGNAAEAGTRLDAALAADPLHPEALYLKALGLETAGNGHLAGILLTRSLLMQSAGKVAGPLVSLPADGLIGIPAPVVLPGEEDNSTAACLARQGAFALSTRQWNEALEHFKQVAELLPRSAAARCNMATACLWAGNFEDAEKELYQAITMEAGLREARCNLGLVLCRQDSAAAALREFKKADGMTGAAGVLANNTAVAQIRSGQEEAGRKVLAGLAEKDGLPPEVYYNALVTSTGSARTGILETMKKLRPEHPLTAYAEALVLTAAGNHDDARDLYRAALTADPCFTAACLGLGSIAAEKEKYPVAQVWLQRAARLDPADPRPHSLLGQVFGALGMKEKELASYEKASTLKRARGRTRKRSDARVVAVTSFEGTDGNAAYGWLDIGLAEALATDLKNLSGVRLVERLKVEKLMAEKMLGTADLLKDPGTVKGVQLDADAVITGSFQVSGSSLRIDGRIINASGGKVAGTASVTGPVDSVFHLERTMALKLLRTMGIPVDGEEAGALSRDTGGSIKALEYLSAGRKNYYLGDLDASLDNMRRAVELNDGYMDALAEMDLVSDEDRLRKTLAVLEFRNASGDETYDWMRSGVAEALMTDLKKVTGLYLVERMDLKKAMDEINLGMTDLVDEATAPKIGRMVGAGVVLIGGYQIIKENVRIDCRMVDVESGGILMGENVQGPLDDIFELEEHLAFKIADMLNVAVSMAEREQIIRKANPTFNALRSIAIAQAGLADAGDDAGTEATLALMRFKNTTATGAQKYDYLQAGIADVLGSELHRAASVRLVDRRVVDAQVGPRQAVRLAGLGTVDRDVIPRVPADFLVQGQFAVADDQLTLQSRVLDVATLTVLGTETVAGPRDRAFNLQQDLARKLALSLEKGSAPGSGNEGSQNAAGRVPVWWSATATGVLGTVMAYYGYRFGVADDRYAAADEYTPAEDWDYLYENRNSYYRKRNFFIGMTVTGLVATGGTVVWNKYLRHKFIKSPTPGKRDTRVVQN